MRAKGLLISGVTLAGLAALFVLAFAVAVPQDALGMQRPTAVPQPPPPGYEPYSPAAPDAYPDLVVQKIQLDPPNPYVNQAVTVYVTIKNIGAADVEDDNNCFLDFYINPPTDDLRGMHGDHYWDVYGWQMRAGQSAVFSYTIAAGFPDTVSYNLWAQVDTPDLPAPPRPYGWVLESNEDNNILGPQYTTVRTHYSWVEKDHEDFFSNMASTLDVVPVYGTVGIITNTPGLEISGDSALALGIFDEPPKTTWGLSPTIPAISMPDYNMINPDTRLNAITTNYQRYPSVAANHIEASGNDLVVGVWEDGRNGPTYGKDVFLRWSKDYGNTWKPDAAGMQVNESYAGHDVNDQKHPAVAVAPNGQVVVAWQDHRDDSFDIYVQVFTYSVTLDLLYACHSNGDCATPCNLATQACNFRVDTGASGKDQILPDISVDKTNIFYIAWQDQRNGNDDIFAVRSYTSTADCPTNREALGFVPHLEPQEAAAPDQIRVCWAGDTRISDDPSATKQASPSISAVDGLKIQDIEYYIVVNPAPIPPTIVVTQVISEATTFVVVAWEDWREGDADIYLTYSDDEGETFVFDQRLNDDKPPNWTNHIEQLVPSVAVNQWMKQITVKKPTEYGEASGQVKLPVTAMHIVWQDYRHSMNALLNDNPDIYYHRISVEPDPNFPWPIVFNHEGQEQVNDNDWREWQTGPVWQGEPDVAATSSGLTIKDSEGYNAYVVWADGRNWGGDFENIDIYFRLFSNVGEPTSFVGGNNVGVNSGARLHNFDVVAYPPYRLDSPPHARQRYPAIASTLVADWPTIFAGYLYVAWDDDRFGDPFEDRNIYLARSNLLFGGHRRIFIAPTGAPPDTPGQGERYGSGSYVSKIFDSKSSDTVWYTVDWHAVTDTGTYITLQTRVGNTRQEVLNGDWYPKRFPYPDDAVSVGAPLQGYDAPGQHIVDASGHAWPQARYIQYRVNFWARNASLTPGVTVLYTPFLYDVILHYERPPIIHLPLVFRNMP